jgi:pheromone shutdown protein TraB
MVPGTASRSSLSAVHAVASDEDASAERWRQWQLRNAVASRTAAKRARIGFTVIFAGLGAWLGLQLLNPSLWP